jgi:hypothetical protein
MGRKFSGVGIALIVGLLAILALAPSAGAKAYNSKYLPGGWSAKTTHAGLCLESLTCPSVTNTATPVKSGSAVLQTKLGSLTGVGARTISTWTSKAFKYTGAEGRLAKEVKVILLRSANTGAFLDVAGNSVTYSVGLVNAGNGVVVSQPVADATETQADAFTKVGPVEIAPNLLKRGHAYKIQIATTFINGATVVPATTVNYRGAKVVAKQPIPKRHHHHHHHHPHH